eukprot:jgi/Ulvmu1/9094/UM005_0189.1
MLRKAPSPMVSKNYIRLVKESISIIPCAFGKNLPSIRAYRYRASTTACRVIALKPYLHRDIQEYQKMGIKAVAVNTYTRQVGAITAKHSQAKTEYSARMAYAGRGPCTIRDACRDIEESQEDIAFTLQALCDTADAVHAHTSVLQDKVLLLKSELTLAKEAAKDKKTKTAKAAARRKIARITEDALHAAEALQSIETYVAKDSLGLPKLWTGSASDSNVKSARKALTSAFDNVDDQKSPDGLQAAARFVRKYERQDSDTSASAVSPLRVASATTIGSLLDIPVLATPRAHVQSSHTTSQLLGVPVLSRLPGAHLPPCPLGYLFGIPIHAGAGMQLQKSPAHAAAAQSFLGALVPEGMKAVKEIMEATSDMEGGPTVVESGVEELIKHLQKKGQTVVNA